MKSELASNRYLRKIGGKSAIVAALFFLILSVYMFGILQIFGFDPVMFDDKALLNEWVIEHLEIYKLSWIFYFLSQLFLFPLPLVLENYFKNGNEKQQALAELSKIFGTAAVILVILCPVIFYATFATNAQAYADVLGSIQGQNIVLAISTLMSDIPKDIRLFSEVFLGIWLAISGYLFMYSGRSMSVGWLTLLVGCWTLIIISVKIFSPYNPLEDFLAPLLAFCYLKIGMHLLKDKRVYN